MENGSNEKYAAVLDFDGVLGKNDAAAMFWKSLGLEKEYFAHCNQIIKAKALHPESKKKTIIELKRAGVPEIVNVVESVHRHWPLPYGTGVSTFLEVQAKKRQIPVAEMQKMGEKVPFTRGAWQLIQALINHPKIGRENIFLNTTTYSPIALAVAKRLGIPLQNVFSTEVYADKQGVIKTGGTANGGEVKVESLKEISRRSGIPIKRMIGFGDATGDLKFQQEITKQGGLAIWFNPAPGIVNRQTNTTEQGRSIIVAAHRMNQIKHMLRIGLEHTEPEKRAQALNAWIKAHNRFRRRAIRRGASEGITLFQQIGKINYTTRERLEQARKKVRGETVGKITRD